MKRRITQASINNYADLSGDRNPLHVDADFASRTPYGGTIAHGLLVGGYIAQFSPRPEGEFQPIRLEMKFVRGVPSGSEVVVRRDSVTLFHDSDPRRGASGITVLADGAVAIVATFQLIEGVKATDREDSATKQRRDDE